MADPETWTREFPTALAGALRGCASGDVPANIAAMRLLMESRDSHEAEHVLADVLARLDQKVDAPEAMRLQAVLDLLRGNPQAWHTVRSVLADVKHDEAEGEPEESIRRWATAFDQAALRAPEGSVALYALGNPDLLNATTAEIVARLREWGLTGPNRAVLDLGCGIGRFGEALAGEVETFVGIDIAGEMIEAARRRCAGLGNVSFQRCSGRDLSVFGDGGFDLVLAVDSFPYLVQSGMRLVEALVAEAARVLKPGGDLVVLNFSYRGDPAEDRVDIRRLAAASGLDVIRDGTREFSLWDGLAFHLRRPPPGMTPPQAEHKPQASV